VRGPPLFLRLQLCGQIHRLFSLCSAGCRRGRSRIGQAPWPRHRLYGRAAHGPPRQSESWRSVLGSVCVMAKSPSKTTPFPRLQRAPLRVLAEIFGSQQYRRHIRNEAELARYGRRAFRSPPERALAGSALCAGPPGARKAVTDPLTMLNRRGCSPAATRSSSPGSSRTRRIQKCSSFR